MITKEQLEVRINNEFQWVSHGRPKLLSFVHYNLDGTDSYYASFESCDTVEVTPVVSSVDSLIVAIETIILGGVFCARTIR